MCITTLSLWKAGDQFKATNGATFAARIQLILTRLLLSYICMSYTYDNVIGYFWILISILISSRCESRERTYRLTRMLPSHAFSIVRLLSLCLVGRCSFSSQLLEEQACVRVITQSSGVEGQIDVPSWRTWVTMTTSIRHPIVSCLLNVVKPK